MCDRILFGNEYFTNRSLKNKKVLIRNTFVSQEGAYEVLRCIRTGCSISLWETCINLTKRRRKRTVTMTGLWSLPDTLIILVYIL